MNSRGSMKIIGLTSVLIFLWIASPLAQEMMVPVEVQLPLFLKVMVFDRNLKGRVGDEIVIGIVYQRKFKRSLRVMDEFVYMMEESPIERVEGIPIHHVSIDADEVDMENAVLENEIDILYIAPMRALKMKKITSLSRTKKITTLTGTPDYVQAGVAVGIGAKGGKPRIIINLPAAKAEGADFTSGLLNLAKVIKE